MAEISKAQAKEFAKRYTDAGFKLAEITSEIVEMKNSFEFMSNETKDNADPFIDAGNVLEKLASLMASVFLYAKDYQNDSEKE